MQWLWPRVYTRQPASVHGAEGAALLQAAGLAAFRGEKLVFRDLDFTVPEGGALLLTGPNGSGKSTLLRVLAGLLRPVAGEVQWDGTVAYVGHQDAVKPALTVAENLR